MAVGALATRVQILPDVIDLSFIPTGAGSAAWALRSSRAQRRRPPIRPGTRPRVPGALVVKRPFPGRVTAARAALRHRGGAA